MIKKSRKTRQKEMIHSEIAASTSLFTADELYNRLKKKDDTIGIATVFRVLKDLRSKEELHSYICGRKMVYSLEKDNHCHFICQKCHSITHFTVDKLDFLRTKIHGDVCHFQIDVHGTCSSCLQKEEK